MFVFIGDHSTDKLIDFALDSTTQSFSSITGKHTTEMVCVHRTLGKDVAK